MLYALQTHLASHMVVHWSVARFGCQSELHSYMEFVLIILLLPIFGAHILCLSFQTGVSVRAKEYLSLALLIASHAQNSLSSGFPWSFKLQELSWINPWTVICNIHNCNGWYPFVGFFCFTFFICGGLVDRFVSCEWTIGKYVEFFICFFWNIGNAGDTSNHTLDHDCNFHLLQLKHGGRSSYSDGLLPHLQGHFLSAESSRWAGRLGRVPLPFPFFAVSSWTEHFPPFEHEACDVQDRQCFPFSSATFQEYAAAVWSFERFLRN